MKLVVVTATLAPARTRQYWETWSDPEQCSGCGPEQVWVCSGCGDSSGYEEHHGVDALAGGTPRCLIFKKEVLGVVPAFALGVRRAVQEDPDIIACLHDDVALPKYWDERVKEFFQLHPRAGLLGFGGALGIGTSDWDYSGPAPHTTKEVVKALARHDFLSNMKEAEAHGRRWYSPRPVAVLDGFSLIGRTEFMLNSWNFLESLGLIHHAYDSAFGLLARRAGWETWLLPLAVHHAGGATAVGNPKYGDWARTQHIAGDAGFWWDAHLKVYEEFKKELPFRVE